MTTTASTASWRCSYLFLSFATPEAVAGEEESRYRTLKWLTPLELFDIARGLVEADERDGYAEAVVNAWWELRS